VIVARDIEAMTESDSDSLLSELVEVRKMIHGLRRRLGGQPSRGPSQTASMKAPSE